MDHMSPVDWRSLPAELVEAIGEKLTLHVDYIRFRAVCGAWRSSTLRIPKHLPCQFPWLMLPLSDKDSYRRAFFDIANNKIHHLNLPELSLLNRLHRLCGSFHGWVVILEASPSIFLFNPLTSERVDLPPLSSFPNVVSFDFARLGREYLIQFPPGSVYYASTREMCVSFIDKIVLSGTPVSGSFVAVALIRQLNVLAYCKRGDNCWKYIEETRFFTEDVTYLNGLFYAINKSGEIAVCDLSGDSPVVELVHTPERMFFPDIQYLVSSKGKLLLVTRFLQVFRGFDQVMKTSDFRLFKLDFSQHRWEEMMSLGNRVLFLGNVSSLALKSSDFPGCKGNKIYFLDSHFDADYCNAHEDVGVFDLNDRSLDQLTCCLTNSDSRLLWPPPVWITPNPC